MCDALTSSPKTQFGGNMKSVRCAAIVVVVVAGGLLIASANAHAYDFANVCPAQAPPKWSISAQAWTQFVNSCIANDAAATTGRAFDRPFWDKCIEKCGLADDAEGRTPPTPAQTEKQATASGIPANPNWCGDVPASPPPPKFSAKDWAAERQRCVNEANVVTDTTCVYICQGAREMWARAKAGTLSLPQDRPDSTTVPQGPFPLPGGGRGYIAPLPPSSGVPRLTLRVTERRG